MISFKRNDFPVPAAPVKKNDFPAKANFRTTSCSSERGRRGVESSITCTEGESFGILENRSFRVELASLLLFLVFPNIRESLALKPEGNL